MKCTVYTSVPKSVRRPILVWSSALLLFLLAACGGNTAPNYTQEGVQVDIFASLGRSTSTTREQASDLSSQGVPVHPATGETGVDTAELEVYSGETRLFFREGRIVDEAEGERVTLTPEDSEVSLFLPEGNYRFALSAFDEQNNVLARGQVEQQVGADSRVSVPLTSLVGSASFSVPDSVTANEVFDAFLEVSPPNRPDLRVPLGDFAVSYEVAEPSVALEGSSNVGVRVAAACDIVEVTATVDNDLSEEVSASASVPVNDEVCEDANETPVGTDLIPPFVSIKSPEANSAVSKDFTLQGDVNDQQSGVDKVEVYEGTLKLGEAEIDAESMMWRFDASLDEGSYTLIAVAFDKAGNTSREEVSVTVEEGAGGGDGGDNPQTCTSPINVPDENLRRTLENTLGLGEGDPITCDALAGLTEFFQGGTDENDNLVEISTLEGLQFATNLVELSISDAVLKDFSAVASLTKLERLNIVQLEAPSLAPLRGLTALTELTLRGPFDGFRVKDADALASLVDLQTLLLSDLGLSDLSPLQGLTELNRLSLRNNNVSDITPLVNNSGLGEGDTIFLQENPLETCPGTEDRAAIDTLIARGAEVLFDEPENCDGEGDGDNGDGTITVTSTSDAASLEDECTLRAAITAANTDSAVGGCPAGDGADTVVLADERYILTEVDNETNGSNGLPTITSEITLQGGLEVTVERAEDATLFRLLYVAEEGNLNLDGVILQNGYATNSPTRNSGGGILNDGTLTLKNFSAVRGSFGVAGGGIDNQGEATLRDSSVSGNTTESGTGGGIFNAGTLTLTDVSITDNFESNGSGFYNTGTLSMQGGRIEGNTTPGVAGVFINEASGVIELQSVEIIGNSDDGGGASNRGGEVTLTNVTYEDNSDSIRNFEGGTLTLVDSTVSGTAENYGPGLDNAGTLRVENSTVEGNVLGGIENSGTAEITKSMVQGNGTDDDQGIGIGNTGTLTLRESTVSNHTGGGVLNSGSMEIDSSTIEDNGPSVDGIVNLEEGTLLITRSLIDGNGSYGVRNSGRVTFTNNTVLDNFTGGVKNLSTGTLEVAFSSIFGYSSGFITAISNEADASAVTVFGTILDTESDFDCAPGDTLTSRGYNFFVSDQPCSFNQDTDIVSDTYPELGTLQDNGGPTLTRALEAGSEAVDYIPTDVCNVETDQRGVSRPQGGACDIGAFEVER